MTVDTIEVPIESETDSEQPSLYSRVLDYLKTVPVEQWESVEHNRVGPCFALSREGLYFRLDNERKLEKNSSTAYREVSLRITGKAGIMQPSVVLLAETERYRPCALADDGSPLCEMYTRIHSGLKMAAKKAKEERQMPHREEGLERLEQLVGE